MNKEPKNIKIFSNLWIKYNKFAINTPSDKTDTMNLITFFFPSIHEKHLEISHEVLYNQITSMCYQIFAISYTEMYKFCTHLHNKFWAYFFLFWLNFVHNFSRYTDLFTIPNKKIWSTNKLIYAISKWNIFISVETETLIKFQYEFDFYLVNMISIVLSKSRTFEKSF